MVYLVGILAKHKLPSCEITVSRLTVVSCTAKQGRVRDTTVCYIHEWSILIERLPKA